MSKKEFRRNHALKIFTKIAKAREELSGHLGDLCFYVIGSNLDDGVKNRFSLMMDLYQRQEGSSEILLSEVSDILRGR